MSGKQQKRNEDIDTESVVNCHNRQERSPHLLFVGQFGKGIGVSDLHVEVEEKTCGFMIHFSSTFQPEQLFDISNRISQL
jgi:hypothetical protein